MKIDIQIDGDHAQEELRSLYSWLLKEPEVRHHADIDLVAQELAPDDMGDALDLITLLVTGGLQLPSLAAVLYEWRQTRRHLPEVTIKRGVTQVVISGADPDLVKKIVTALEDQV